MDNYKQEWYGDKATLMEHKEEKTVVDYGCSGKGSLSQFQKVFYQIYGDTPYSYLKCYKMNLAANMIENGKKKISDIALEIGYSNPSKFSEAFKSVYGVSPNKYRRKSE